MNIYILKDLKINGTDFKKVKAEFRTFIKQHTVIDVKFTIVDYDFSFYPTDIDGDYDVRPQFTWMKSLVATMEDKHSKHAFDHLFTLIHEDNWRSDGKLFLELQNKKKKGIWGTNYSYTAGDIHFHYCRWDKDNLANVFGTLYHEWTHSLDALVQVETGVDINPIVHTVSYDRDMTHGAGSQYEYIRHKENTSALSLMRKELQAAYNVRRRRQLDELKGELSLLVQLQSLWHKLQMLLNRKDGVKLK